jgi:hypothetical protein
MAKNLNPIDSVRASREAVISGYCQNFYENRGWDMKVGALGMRRKRDERLFSKKSGKSGSSGCPILGSRIEE